LAATSTPRLVYGIQAAMTSPRPLAIAGQRLERRSLADQAYERLRNAIAEGGLTAGERLTERQLCEELGVSRTPLREAMIRLQHDGLLTARPSGGVVVTSVDEHEADEILAIRIPLESYAAALAARNRDERELQELMEIVAVQRDHLATLDRPELAAWNDRFHEVLYTASKKRRLAALIEQHRKYTTDFRVYEVYSEAELREGVRDHERIAAAIATKDAVAVEQLMRAHLLRGQAVLHEKRVSKGE
jgi:DNA-binding GntR family transcriptional regulator